jgi:hypothetical protein
MWRHQGWSGTLALSLAIALGLIWYAGTISRHEKWIAGWRRHRRTPTPPMAIRALG